MVFIFLPSKSPKQRSFKRSSYTISHFVTSCKMAAVCMARVNGLQKIFSIDTSFNNLLVSFACWIPIALKEYRFFPAIFLADSNQFDHVLQNINSYTSFPEKRALWERLIHLFLLYTSPHVHYDAASLAVMMSTPCCFKMLRKAVFVPISS